MKSRSRTAAQPLSPTRCRAGPRRRPARTDSGAHLNQPHGSCRVQPGGTGVIVAASPLCGCRPCSALVVLRVASECQMNAAPMTPHTTPRPASNAATPRASCGSVLCVAAPTPSSATRACAVPLHARSRAFAWTVWIAAVKPGPVAAVDLELACDSLGRDRIGNRNRLAIADVLGGHRPVLPGEILLGQDDGLRPVQRVISDRRHLVHVLSRAVDQWVVGVEVGVDDGEAPIVFEQRHDLGPLRRCLRLRAGRPRCS